MRDYRDELAPMITVPNLKVEGLWVCGCAHCKQVSVWYNAAMIYPSSGSAPLPHDELPDDMKGDYEEARSIVSASPRSAAGLLRLVVQKLMVHLGEKGKDINTDIGNLVKNGLPVEIQEALDSVRVIGNESVHPGTICLNDTPEIAYALFDVVNFIVDDRIAQPKKRASLYASLPPAKRKGIADRDK